MQQEQVAVYDLFPIIKITWRLPYKSFDTDKFLVKPLHIAANLVVSDAGVQL